MRRAGFAALMIVFSVCCALLFFAFYRDARDAAVANLHEEQRIHARQAARSIEDFFATWTSSLTALSGMDEIIEADAAGRREVRLFSEAHHDQIWSISRVDERGVILVSYPFRRVEGVDISDQKHMREILRDHRPVVSDVFRAVQGFDAIALHVPVFKGTVFRGSIAVVINFESLAKRYFDVIRIGKTGAAWVVSRDGTLLYTPIPGFTGRSAFESFKASPSVLGLLGEMLQGREGTATYVLNGTGTQAVGTARYFAVYAPIRLGSTFWSVVVASSEQELLAGLNSYKNRLALVVGIVYVGGMALSTVAAKAWLIVREEEKRRQAEQESARLTAEELKAKERIISILESVSDAFVSLDRDWRYVYVNEQAGRLFGRRPADLIGKHIWTEFPEGSDQPFARAYRKALAEQVPLQIEDYYAPWDRWFENRIYPSPEGLSIFFHEITDRKKAEERLAESEARLRLAASAGNVGFWTWNLRTNAVYFSPEWKRQLGYEEDEIPQRFEEWEARLHPDDHAGAVARVARFLEKPDGTFESVFRLGHKDGSYRWIYAQGRAFLDGEGRPVEMLGCHIDITERKRIEEALRTRERELALVFDNVADVIFVLVPESGSQFRFLSVNRAFLEVTGLSEEQVAGRLVEEVIPEPSLTLVVERYREAVRQKKTVRWEETSEYPSGRKIGLVSITPLFDSKGACSTLIGTVYDITEQKQSEEQLHALTERLQSVREEEAARIAREIHDEPGQNLTALRMDLAWLKRELAEKGGSHDEAALARHVDGMTDLVEQTVRTVQRISEELRPGALDRLGLAAAVEARLEDFGRRAGIAARLDDRLENLDVDHALSTTAYRIVQELLTNVVRHAGATEVVVTLAEEKGELVLSLKDNGRGITAAEIAAPRSLGLAGMRERASLAGGSFELAGEPGRGTLATVRLPLVPGRPS